MISCSSLLTSRFVMTLKKKTNIKTNRKLQMGNDNGKREKRLRSPTGHKLIILSSELQVRGDSCLIWLCHRGDLIPQRGPATAASQTLSEAERPSSRPFTDAAIETKVTLINCQITV